ncbi:beta-N-acetylglucosaminidase domain-containing protein [Streptomyces sp. LHD-70]|uniref:beta-N-acetylhexosaminidase family protein n=1 Tax=Streptomyces sp. LHD-70 TaxID=3072140 RepID=UPI00280F5042|nr:beta-N-acetylglucosaminidase domain-containing protein [Streptomyces sp. LHD-70]MDQ8707973.1 beta-N-acetylglucosaminidase domain-containing protein [Streptomyces sp. LHD-70]
MPRTRRTACLVTGLAVAGLLAPAAPSVAETKHDPPIPALTPQPQKLDANGRALEVPRTVRLALGDDVDEPTRELVTGTLREAGAKRIEEVDLAEAEAEAEAETAAAADSEAASDSEARSLTVIVGSTRDNNVVSALEDAGGQDPGEHAEGYALATSAKSGTAVLAGVDADGTYYAAQTLKQLTRDRSIAGVSVTDHPTMALRGGIEGFYGSPWTHEERMDQLAFYGDVKMNTYIYAPKDDPYHREKWREPYPADKLAELGELVRQATDHHVRFTFAVSPGESICFSDAADLKALEAKLRSMYDLGVRSFSVPLDDIQYGEWNCDADQAKYGDPGQEGAGKAQVELLNSVQEFLAGLDGTKPLQMVPTEYWDAKDTAYKTQIRENLDPDVEIMWTGPDVVPFEITRDAAAAAEKVWGRKVFLWDNYPVNDFGQSAGRLHLAPYDKREAGLEQELSGIVLNPMNQAAASKVALYGGADFSWNTADYDARRAWRASASYLADGSPDTVKALLAFFDTQHYGSTFTDPPKPWQPQAPELDRRLAEFKTAWADSDGDGDGDGDGDRSKALRELRDYADLLAGAPEQIRSGVSDAGFVADSEPWLKSLDLWGDALLATLDGLEARAEGDDAQAEKHFASSAKLAEKAAAVMPDEGETRPEGPIKVADGVLDTFLTDAPKL